MMHFGDVALMFALGGIPMADDGLYHLKNDLVLDFNADGDTGVGVFQDDGERDIIAGYATRFYKPSGLELGHYRIQIAPSAFDSLTADSDVIATKGHNFDMVLGRTIASTLELNVDRRGLFMRIDPPDATYANDLLVSMKRGDTTGGSFIITGVSIESEVKNKGRKDEYELETVVGGTLREVTVTPIPRIPAAQVGVTRADGNESADTDGNARRIRIARAKLPSGVAA